METEPMVGSVFIFVFLTVFEYETYILIIVKKQYTYSLYTFMVRFIAPTKSQAHTVLAATICEIIMAIFFFGDFDSIGVEVANSQKSDFALVFLTWLW